ncbi:MAG: SBBP repeat-containing protein [Bryobacteraceae bacterium]|jgi:uncharacterized protein (TIGR03437 family)
MLRTCIVLLLYGTVLTGVQLNLIPLPGAFPYSYAAQDPSGNIYLAGTTAGTIPLLNPIQSTLSSGNCSPEQSYFQACPTAFVAKLDPTGTKIVYSTYLGSGQQYAVSGLAVDTAGSVYLSGTASPPSFMPSASGQAFLYKLNPAGSALLYSLSIAASTSGNAVAVDSAGNAYFAGASFDSNFPTFNSTFTMPQAKNTFATNDGGATWHDIDGGLPAQSIVNSLAIDPTNTAVLYAATTTGIFKSVNAGIAWAQLLPAATTAQQILLDPKSPSTLYVLHGPSTPATQFAKSTDGGNTWQDLTAALPPAWVPTVPLSIGSIALDPENSQNVWMSIDAIGAPSVFRSTDGGQQWQDVHDFPAYFVATAASPGASGTSVFVDPTDSSRVYVCCTAVLASTAHGVFRSDDGGQTWIVGGPGIASPPVVDPADPSTLYSSGNALVVSTNEGQTWTQMPMSPLAPATRAGNLAVEPTGGLYQVFDYGTLLKSTNGGSPWTALTGPWIENSEILALDPVNPSSTFYVASATPSGEHAFLTKIDPSGAYVWATVFGGSELDSAQAVAVDAAGNPYVAGVTSSLDFPTVNAFQPTNASQPAGRFNSAFITRFDTNGKIIYSSYLGGSSNQTVTAIAADADGNAYVAGYTASSDFPVLNPLQATRGFGLSTGFVSKIEPSGGALIYSTYLGGTDTWAVSAVSAMAITPQGGVWVAGSTSSIALPLVGALQPSNTGDEYLAEIDPTGARWEFSTYIGQNILAVSPQTNGNLWLALGGSTGELDFGPPPTTPAGVPLILSTYNAASFALSDIVAPGEAVAIFGEQFASAAQQAPSYPLPNALGGVSVTVGGIAAPLYYVSPGQIKFQVPYGVPLGSAALAVTSGSQTGQRTLTIAAVAPGIFTASGDGNSSNALVVHASDYSRVTASNPAHAGEYLAMFCTGLGATDPPATAGQAAQTAGLSAEYFFGMDISGREAMTTYAGLAALPSQLPSACRSRAWRRGYRLRYGPSSHVVHRKQSTRATLGAISTAHCWARWPDRETSSAISETARRGRGGLYTTSHRWCKGRHSWLQPERYRWRHRR